MNRKKIPQFHKVLWQLALSGLCLMLSSCVKAPADPVSVDGFLFDTFISITIYDQCDSSVTEGCYERLIHYDTLFNKTRTDSDIYRINHAGGKPVIVSEETFFLLSQAVQYAELTEGKIDPTIEAVNCLWDFHPEHGPEPPARSDINEALTHVDYRNILLEQSGSDENGGTVYSVTLLDPQSALDPGFIAKGYIADQLKDYLLESGVQNAIINLGGNALVLGTKPWNMPFRVAVEKPFEDGVPIAVFSLTDSSLVTSGIYHRYFYYDDTLYHHILDANTGYPVSNHLYSVSILGESSLACDALSTSCFVLGVDDGMELIESMDGYEAMFILDDGTIVYSSGFPQPVP